MLFALTLTLFMQRQFNGPIKATKNTLRGEKELNKKKYICIKLHYLIKFDELILISHFI